MANPQNTVQLSQVIGLVKVISPGPKGPPGPNGGISEQQVQDILNVPIRLNPRTVSRDFLIPADFTANSVGPIEIVDGVTVTMADNSKWSIS